MGESRIGRSGQVKVYMGKCFRTFFNEKGWKTLISTLIIALILSWVIGDYTFVYREDTKYGLFAMICGCLWTGLFNSIQSICRERAIIKREHRTGLHISSYVIAHLLFELVLSVFEGIIMTAVLGFVRGMPEYGVVFPLSAIDFFVGFTLVIFASDALGILVSCIVKTENAAMTVMPFVLIIQLVMSGMMFILPPSADFVKNLTVSKWGLTALCSSADTNSLESDLVIMQLFQKNKSKLEDGTIDEYDLYELMNSYEDGELDEDELERHGLSTDDVQLIDEEYEADAGNVIGAWFVLIAFSLIYAFIGILFLKLVDKDKR